VTTVLPVQRSNHSVTSAPSETDPYDVVVIGGGQAGLATGYYLTRQGLHFVILDAHPRVGDAWRSRWDSLRLFTPTRYNNLPGMNLRTAGPFPTKDELADYLKAYAHTFALPVRTSTSARSVHPSGNGHDTWLVETADGVIEADNVVVAAGSYGRPRTPEFASQLDPEIVQIHSHHYRNPLQYQPGPVLVVGASNSGAEIAIEAAREHEVILAGRDPGEIPFRIERPYAKAIFPILWFVANNVLTENTPPGRQLKPLMRAHGGPLVRTKHNDLAAAGVDYTTSRVADVQDGKSVLDDGTVLDVRNIVWCTGFHSDFSWISGLTYGTDGYPEQHLGAAEGASGLYFMGLKFQRAFASSLVGGAGRDAKHVVDHIAARARQTA
jgi:putative flavoprotein involved in K+ transport